MSVLTGKNLTKHYGANDVFIGIDLRIEHEDRIGLVGPNGAGKSSLLKIMAGVEPRDAGSIDVAGGVRIGYLPQDPPGAGGRTLFADLRAVFDHLLARGEELRKMEERMTASTTTDGQMSGRQMEALLAEYGRKQEAFERDGGYTIDQRIKTVLSGLGLEESLWHEPLENLSGGQRTRALLGRLLLEEPDLLLLDEPTNHLDVRSVEWLEERLLAWPGVLVVVSHDRYFLNRVTNRIWELSHRRLETYRGNYDHYRRQRADRLAEWQAEYEKQQKYIKETQEFIRRYKAGQRAKEARGRETRLQRFIEEEALPPPPSQERIRLPLTADARSGDLVIRTKNLVVGYRNVSQNGRQQGDLPILRVPDLEARRSEVIALLGPNGTGKTTLLRTLLGELEPLNGQLQFGAGVEVGYLAQRHTGTGSGHMKPGQSVLNALLDIENLSLERARTYLAQFLFKGDDVFKSINSLSGGQRSRIALARLTLQGANFLLLDEPTNHLDLDSQEILEDALRQFSGTVLLVTHDRALVEALATQIWYVRSGEGDGPNTLDIFRGTWKQWQQEQGGAGQPPSSPDSALDEDESLTESQRFRERQREERRRRQEAAKREKDLAEIEEQIQHTEEQIKILEKEMAQASLDQDLNAVQRINKEHQKLRQQLEAEMEQWEKLAEEVAQPV